MVCLVRIKLNTIVDCLWNCAKVHRMRFTGNIWSTGIFLDSPSISIKIIKIWSVVKFTAGIHILFEVKFGIVAKLWLFEFVKTVWCFIRFYKICTVIKCTNTFILPNMQTEVIISGICSNPKLITRNCNCSRWWWSRWRSWVIGKYIFSCCFHCIKVNWTACLFMVTAEVESKLCISACWIFADINPKVIVTAEVKGCRFVVCK